MENIGRKKTPKKIKKEKRKLTRDWTEKKTEPTKKKDVGGKEGIEESC